MQEKIKVTHLNGFYGVRYLRKIEGVWRFHGGLEYRCEYKIDQAYCCKELARWLSKLGYSSPLLDNARERFANCPLKPIGKVWSVMYASQKNAEQVGEKDYV